MHQEHGEQPLKERMREHALDAKALVAAGKPSLTFKVIKKACAGRRLTSRMQFKIAEAFNQATGTTTYTWRDLFTYHG